MTKSLTVRAIDAIKNPDERQEVSDGGATGLWLVIQPSGQKSWAFRYRSPVDNKPKKYTIGRYPDFTIGDARDEARGLARQVRRGECPATIRQMTREYAADRSTEVGNVLDLFIDKHVKVKNSDKTIKTAVQRIEQHVRPAWEGRKIETITRQDVVKLTDGILDAGHDVTANRVFSTVRKFFNWAIEKGHLNGANPCTGMKLPGVEESRERVLEPEEIRWLWKATEAGGNYDRCVRALLLSACRKGEVGGALRGEFLVDEIHGAHWLIPPTRTKNKREHVLPTSPLLLGLFEGVPQIGESDIIFTTNGEVPSSGWSKSQDALMKRMLQAARDEAEERGEDPEGVEVKHWTLHDLRRTAATGIAEMGIPPHVLEAVLNHTADLQMAVQGVSKVARIYNRYKYYKEKSEALALWENRVLSIASGKPSNIVPLRGAR